MVVAARSIEHLSVEEGPDDIKGRNDDPVWTTRVDNVTHAGVSLASVFSIRDVSTEAV
jgi:hypothetical protein